MNAARSHTDGEHHNGDTTVFLASVIEDDGGPVTVETVTVEHYTNEITANAAVHAKMSKTQFIRWLLDDRQKREREWRELARRTGAA